MAERQSTLDTMDELYQFILSFSKKHLRFPKTSELEVGFDKSGTSLYDLIDRLIADGRIEKVGRYGYGIVAYSPETLAKKSAK